MKVPQGFLACLAATMMVLATGVGAAMIEGSTHHAVAKQAVLVQPVIAKLRLDVTASCQGRAVIFSVVNKGDAWPGVAAIKIVRASDRAVISQRDMRMAKLQKGSLRLDGKKNPGGEIGLFVDPSWSQRPFTLDAKATCG